MLASFGRLSKGGMRSINGWLPCCMSVHSSTHALFVAVQVQRKSAAMMFIELMFWKNAMVAEQVREEYNWRVMLTPCFPKM